MERELNKEFTHYAAKENVVDTMIVTTTAATAAMTNPTKHKINYQRQGQPQQQ